MHGYSGGPTSWMAVVTLFGVFGVRMLSSRRRRGGGPGGAGRARGFTPGPRTSSPSLTGSSSDPTTSTATGGTGTAPGWFVDPFVRHEHRYWSGTGWTEHVMDGGTPTTDPPPTPRGA